jgi:transcription elongation factor GreB
MTASNLITRAGWQALDAELKFLWKEERPRVTKVVTWAAQLGDRSENADYKENKRLLRSIDRRIRYLVKRLEETQIVDYNTQQEGRVYFGAYVALEKEDDSVLACRIVGVDEIDPKHNFISVNAPLAQALFGKEVDDEVVVKTPSGEEVYYVIGIQYKPFEDPAS